MRLPNASMSKLMILASIIFAMALMPQALRANSITETFTFATLSGYSHEAGTSFNQFNSALGTLNSITLNATAIATWSGGGPSDTNQARYTLTLAGNAFVMDALGIGNGSGPAFIRNFNVSSGAALAQFTGSGSIVPSVLVRNKNGTSASINSTFGTESVTYNYTPPATAAEPGSLALLSIVLAGFALVWLMGRKNLAGA
ncbi:MAG: hypothetical protein ACRD1N_02840 [Terriglobia bacterium]